MDVGPLVIPHAQAVKLIQPRKRPLDHPPPPPEATPVPRATPRQERANPTPAQPTPNRLRVVPAIPDCTVRSPARSTAFALKWGNRIHQGQCFLRVVSIGASQADGKGHALPVANQMTLASALGPIGGIRTGLVSRVHCADGTAIDHRPRPINLLLTRQPIEQREVDEIPHTRLLPVAHPAPARHPRPTPEFLRQHLPRDTAAEDKENAGQTGAIRHARPSTLRSSRWTQQERFDKIPQRIREQRGGHNHPRYCAATGSSLLSRARWSSLVTRS